MKRLDISVTYVNKPLVIEKLFPITEKELMISPLKKIDEESRNNVPKKATSQKTHQCSVCSKQFSTAYSANLHYKLVHNHIRNYKCDHCQKSFGRKPELERHIEARHQMVKYKCDVCSSVFTSKSYLTHHKRKHLSTESVPKYRCKECEKEYKDAGGLRRHVKSIHLNIKFKCDPCKKVLSYEGALELVAFILYLIQRIL